MYVKTIRPYSWDREKKAYFRRYDQAGIPEYTFKLEEARQFETQKEALSTGGRGGKVEKYEDQEVSK